MWLSEQQRKLQRNTVTVQICRMLSTKLPKTVQVYALDIERFWSETCPKEVNICRKTLHWPEWEVDSALIRWLSICTRFGYFLFEQTFVSQLFLTGLEINKFPATKTTKPKKKNLTTAKETNQEHFTSTKTGQDKYKLEPQLK